MAIYNRSQHAWTISGSQASLEIKIIPSQHRATARLTCLRVGMKRGQRVEPCWPGRNVVRMHDTFVRLLGHAHQHSRHRLRASDRLAGELGDPKHLGAVDSLCAYAGIVLRTLHSGRPDAPPDCSYHALRHSLTSALANSDVSPEIRRKIIGHDFAAVHNAYTHHERKTLAEALEKLPAV